MTYRIFLDTNILADHLLDRNQHSSNIINLVESGQIIAYASSASFFTLAYIIEDRLKLKSQPILQKFNQFVNTIPTGQSVLDYSYASGFHDMEDAFQYFTALSVSGLDFFITNNVKDYKLALSKLPVLTAKDFITIISKEL
jgi:predicted nucleic acid-binding protein